MSDLRLLLLGPPQITWKDKVLVFESRKAVALLAYLAVTGMARSRADLATLLWPESDQGRALGALRYTLSLLKKGPLDRWLLADRQQVGLDLGPECYFDVTEFDRLVTESQAHEHGLGELCPACVEALTAAGRLYRDDFLAGFSLRDSPDFDEWQFFQIESLRRKLTESLKPLIRHHAARSDFEPAIAYSRRWLKLDPLHEPAQRALMELYAAAGEWAAALRQYEECAELLNRELAVAPAPETTSLYERIRRDKTARQGNAAELPILVAASPAQQPAAAVHLPAQSTPFVGRQVELNVLAQRLASPEVRLLTLVGPGGVGKSRLGLEVAAAQSHSFADGVYFVPLAALDLVAHMVPAIADALQLSFYEGREPYAQLLDYLGTKHLLLILDNLEHLLITTREDCLSFITSILQATTSLKILVTSRERLRLQQEYVYPVSGLGVPDDADNIQVATSLVDGKDSPSYAALELFRQRAERFQPDLVDTDLNSTIRICQVTQGMPLAIELAATMVGAVPLPVLAAEIERNLDILTSDLHDLYSRHRSIRAVFDSSWQALTPSEQSAFTRLAIFRGGFTLRAAEQVAQTSLTQLVGLVNKSLIRLSESGRYQMHELMHQYASEKLSEGPEEKKRIQQQHCSYYGGYLSDCIAQWQADYRLECIDEIVTEIDNIRTGWQWLLINKDVSGVIVYLENLWQFYSHRGRFSEAVDMLSQALELIRREQAVETIWQQAEWERLLGDAYFGLGRSAASQQHLHQALSLLGQSFPLTNHLVLMALPQEVCRQIIRRVWLGSTDSITSPSGRPALLTAAYAYDRITQIALLRGKYLLGGYAVLRGLNLMETAGPAPVLAVTYANMSLLCGLLSRHRWAEMYLKLAQETAEKLNHLPSLAAVALRNGAYRISIGQWDQAQWQFEHALHLYQQLQNWRHWGDCLAGLGSIAYLQGHFRESYDYAVELEKLTHHSHNVEHQAWAVFSQANALLYLGQMDAAALGLKQALPFLDLPLFAPFPEAMYYGTMGIIYFRQGQLEAARQVAEVAANLMKPASPSFFGSIPIYCNLAELYFSMLEQALLDPNTVSQTRTHLQAGSWQASRDLSRSARYYTISRPYASLYHGLHQWLIGQRQRAQWSWRKSLVQAQRLGMRYGEGRAHLEIGRHLAVADPKRQEHLQRAEQIFTEIEAGYYLAEVQALLA